jgi:hypothetical protein
MIKKFEINGMVVSLNLTEGHSKIKVEILMEDHHSVEKDTYYLTKRVIFNEFKLHKEIYKAMKNLSDKWRMFDIPSVKAKFHTEFLESSNEYALRLAE